MNTARRQREARAPQGPPPFAGIDPPERRCACPDCPVPGGAVLSRFNEGDLCWQCQEAGRKPSAASLFAGVAPPQADVVLWEVVAGLLLLQRNLRPGEPLKLRETLAELGVEATTGQVHDAVRSCQRRGMVIDRHRGRAGGHRLVESAALAFRRRPRR